MMIMMMTMKITIVMMSHFVEFVGRKVRKLAVMAVAIAGRHALADDDGSVCEIKALGW